MRVCHLLKRTKFILSAERLFHCGKDSKRTKKPGSALCVSPRTTVSALSAFGSRESRVRPIVRALGAGRDLREPEEVFAGILDEGEEVTLVSGLKLCRRMLHREPVIELIGVDPYKFAEIRSLGLLNEQIDWKQRFFVPTDEGSGISVISALVDRYPILISSEFDNVEAAEPEIVSELRATQVVDLDKWFVPVESLSSQEPEPIAELAIALSNPAETPESILTGALTNSLSIPQSDAGEMQLAFDF